MLKSYDCQCRNTKDEMGKFNCTTMRRKITRLCRIRNKETLESKIEMKHAFFHQDTGHRISASFGFPTFSLTVYYYYYYYFNFGGSVFVDWCTVYMGHRLRQKRLIGVLPHLQGRVGCVFC